MIRWVMNKYTFSGGLLFVFILIVGVGIFMREEVSAHECTIKTVADIEQLFSYDPQEIKKRFAAVTEYLRDGVEDILAVPVNDRSFANTIKPIDELSRYVTIHISPLFDQSYVNPSKDIRHLVQAEYLQLDQVMQNVLSKNVELYKACESYVNGNYKKEKAGLNSESVRLVTELMKRFKRNGLDLPADKLNELKDITNKLNALEIEFDKNIAEENRKLHVTREELAGTSDDFINNLKKTDDGKYILGTDYPTFFGVMNNSTVEATRKKMYELFENRAYPANMPVLDKVIALRDKLGKLLGYNSYAEYELDDQMIKTPKRAYDFINGLIDEARSKQKDEFEKLTKELPASVVLDADGKIKPWDKRYLKEEYKKKHFNLDDEKIAEYFPVDNTLKEVFDIYQTLLDLKFESIKINNLWHEDVRAIKIIDKRTDNIIGYLLLDLYPRDGKYTHACHDTLVAAQKLPNGTICPALSIVIANFPKPQNGRPGLLKHDDVKTFFHEFGHAMHALLGATEMVTFAGTSVKTDFVETPSQMFEKWLDDEELLQRIGRHYKTGEPLPKDIIEKLVGIIRFDSGSFIAGQGYYSLLALDYFGPGEKKDTQEISEKLYKKSLPYTQWVPDTHFQAAFGHLMGYGAQYYGYLWSRVFALDLFDTIKKEGMLSPKAGQRFIDDILGKGGSEDPNVLLKNYLGREPNQEAFLKEYGIK